MDSSTVCNANKTRMSAWALVTLRAAVAICLAMSLVSVSLVIAGTAAGAAARLTSNKTKYVSGRLSAPGYTLALVGYNGKTVLTKKTSFRVAAPDAKVTLQLISPHGLYAGPVVLGGTPTRVIVGIKAGANVGTIVVVASKGYAHLAHKLAARYLDKSRWAYAKGGVPIGNGSNFGLVVSKAKGSVAGAGLDPAHVGVPNEFDIAVPGTKILKALAPTTRKSGTASAAAECPPAPQPAPPGCTTPAGPNGGAPQSGSLPTWMAQMVPLGIANTVNADAAGVTPAEIDSTLRENLNIKLFDFPTSASLVELDCNGLSYCSEGGTGQAELEGLPTGTCTTSCFEGTSTVPFPAAALDPATGFGELIGPAAPNGLLSGQGLAGGKEFSLLPNATSAQIGSGDVATVVSTSGGVTTQAPATLGFVFNTVPAIASYSDTEGDSGTIAYPDTSGFGEMNNPIKAAAGANGDVVVSFTVFRPQRPGIPGAGEPAFMDLGNLKYAIGDTGSKPASCPASAYSDLSPTLSLVANPLGSTLVDSASDQPASPTNTISFTVDLTQCYIASGPASFPVGQSATFTLTSTSQSSNDHASQLFTVQRTR